MSQVAVSLTLPDGRTGTSTIDITDPTEATAPAREPMEVGLSVKDTEWGTWYKALPGAKFGRHFTPMGKGAPNIAASRKMPVPGWYSHKDPVPLDQVLACWEALRALGLKGQRFRWTFRHEGENYPLPVHRSYYRDLRTLRDDNGFGDLILLSDVRTLYACRYKTTVNWREWMLPGVVDEVSWDCYAPTTWDTYEPVESLFGLPLASAAEFGMDLSIAEVGAVRRKSDVDGTGRGRYLAQGVDYLAAHGVRAVGLWCSKETDDDGKTLDYRPTTAPELALWREILTKPR